MRVERKATAEVKTEAVGEEKLGPALAAIVFPVTFRVLFAFVLGLLQRVLVEFDAF